VCVCVYVKVRFKKLHLEGGTASNSEIGPGAKMNCIPFQTKEMFVLLVVLWEKEMMNVIKTLWETVLMS